jgi:hypothetical protein
VELLAILWLLVGLQCLVWLPRGAVLFARPLRGWLASPGPGLRLLHPWPSAPSLLALRLPVVEVEGRLHGRGAASWLRAAELGPLGDAANPQELAGASVRGTVVRVAGRPFARGASPAHAQALAALLRELGDPCPDAQRQRAAQALTRSLSLARYRAAAERARAATRALAWSSDTYAAALLVALPVATALVGAETALWWGAPALAGLHATALVCFARAHARLLPEARDARVEELFAAALYPPLLLRAHHALRAGALAGFHPAAVAAAVLPEPARGAFLRAELAHAAARAEAAAHGEGGLDLARLEQRALCELAREAGEDVDALLAAPARSDPRAEGYCPACRVEYRRGATRCSDCRLGLARYAPA